MSLFVSGSHWFSIASGQAFLDDLATGLMAELGEGLSKAQILTPTRRGARAMALAFSNLTKNKALLLPQIRAIGDLDEGEPPFDLEYLGLDLPAAVSPSRRRFELARLILDHYKTEPTLNSRTALELADSLSGFFDSLALEDIEAHSRLTTLVQSPSEHGNIEAWAEHWQISARFLSIAVDLWPRRLTELGLMDPSVRQVTLIKRLAEQWQNHPPLSPLVLAGSTGTAPAMADLMGVISNLPQGAVILPGLDFNLADDAWAQVEDSHPQGALKRLLDRHGLTRSDVRPWAASVEANRSRHARRRLINEALRPAEATKDWRAQIKSLRAESPMAIREGLSGLNLVSARHDEEAAAVIALLMREALETKDKTVAFITPDITLSRRVSAYLSRFGLSADSSAGEPLINSQTGRFFSDLLTLILEPNDPVALLSLLKSPLSRFNQDETKSALSDLELKGLRGAKPTHLSEIMTRLTHAERFEALGLWEDYLNHWQAHQIAPKTDLSDHLRALLQWAEALVENNGQVLWQGASGAAAAHLLSDLLENSQGYLIESSSLFVDILRVQLRKATVRTGGNTHPRLRILGAIEARLVSADRIILGGLEDGVWPQAAPVDPFLSRPMRQALGLPSPERRTGLSAHDFVQAASGPDVWLVTRQRRESQPQVPSRWLWRLKTLCGGANETIPEATDWLDMARSLDAPIGPVPAHLKGAQRPTPTPPLEVRPFSLSVTQIETLVRDPYAIYARHILKLKPLERLNEPFEALKRGIAIHAVVEAFVRDNHPLGPKGEAIFANLLETQLRAENLTEAQLALQRPLFSELAREFVAFETGRRELRPYLLIEQSGQLQFETPRGPFTLKAKADRIDVHEGGIDIVDFKTGLPPSFKSVVAGFYPQLTLTAAIIKHGQFEGLDAHHRSKPLGKLIYVRINSDKVTSKELYDKKIPLSTDDLAEHALLSLKKRILKYDQPSQAYRSWTAPQFRHERGGDYDHLARLYEWEVLGEDESQEEAKASE
jgi:ATP-dependent helicase/nuclease subunit B